MKKLHLFSIALLLASSFAVFGQKKKEITIPLCGFKTYDDFFAGNCRYMCDYNESHDDVIFKGKNKVTGKKFKFHMKKDSAMVGYKGSFFNYRAKYIVSPDENYYRMFLCGTKKLFAAIPSLTGQFMGKFNENGEVTEGKLYSMDVAISVIFIKDLNFKNETRDIEKAIGDNKIVYDKYLTEKEATNKKEWEKNKLSIAIKYVKMYNEN